ncbi:hypothetical protein PANT_20d00079 [Moesziomyces antarcticus T-34]|uniref:Transmembrane protein n=1 Tax=Pseudozyma antarctica (strain T-34) TaxID=1151754 RepID=M9LZC7_PSEA3|nr:hypothetical protein PANT_20d00079 [Moesziomyces antarcticus T-34]
MQAPRMVRMVRQDRRQVNPAAFSGVTDQISNLGQSAGDKASKATSGLTRTQTSLVIVFCIIGSVAVVSALFWVCSYSRRKKRSREMKEKAELLKSSSSSSSMRLPQTTAAAPPRRASRSLNTYNDGWGESRVALNSSFVASTNERYGWDQSQTHLATPSLPRAPQQSHHYRP